MHISNPPQPDSAAASTEDSLQVGLAHLRAARARRRKFMIAGGVALVAVAVGAAQLMSGPPAVKVMTVREQPAERVLAVTGRVKPRETVQVYPRAAGQIVSLAKDEGDLVKAGDVLGQIDPARARAAVVQASAAMDAQSRTLAQAERDLERAQNLLARGSVTVTSVETAALAVGKGREELRRLAAARDDARLRLEELSIIAPFDGRILNRPVDPGQVVDAKTAMFAIAPIAAQEVETEVDETYSMALRDGQDARLSFAGLPQPVTGRVSYLAPEIQTSTGGRIVRLAFEPPADAPELPVGLTVDVNIIVARDEAAITVPRPAIRDSATTPYVLTVKDGRVARQDISFVDWPAASVVVSKGLAAGDQIIMSPKAPAPGSKVKVEG